MRRVLRLFRAVSGALIVLTLLQATSWAETPAGAKALESRLYAPCCYGGTLDIHESDLARSLREEIESRLARGESSDVIQSDFVARYGDKVLAARSDLPIRAMGIGLALLAMLSAVGLVVVMRRWTRRARDEAPLSSLALSGTRDELDERIDAELAELDAP